MLRRHGSPQPAEATERKLAAEPGTDGRAARSPFHARSGRRRNGGIAGGRSTAGPDGCPPGFTSGPDQCRTFRSWEGRRTMKPGDEPRGLFLAPNSEPVRAPNSEPVRLHARGRSGAMNQRAAARRSKALCPGRRRHALGRARHERADSGTGGSGMTFNSAIRAAALQRRGRLTLWHAADSSASGGGAVAPHEDNFDARPYYGCVRRAGGGGDRGLRWSSASERGRRWPPPCSEA
jgi:hypothetical protein